MGRSSHLGEGFLRPSTLLSPTRPIVQMAKPSLRSHGKFPSLVLSLQVLVGPPWCLWWLWPQVLQELIIQPKSLKRGLLRTESSGSSPTRHAPSEADAFLARGCRGIDEKRHVLFKCPKTLSVPSSQRPPDTHLNKGGFFRARWGNTLLGKAKGNLARRGSQEGLRKGFGLRLGDLGRAGAGGRSFALGGTPVVMGWGSGEGGVLVCGCVS